MRLLLDVSAVPERLVGAGVYTVALARGLATGAADMELVLLARTDDGDRWTRLCATAEVHTLVPTRRPARLVWEQTQAPRLAKRLAIDVWHGPHYTIPERMSVPTTVTIHDLTFFDHPEMHERSKVWFFRRAIHAAARHAAQIVCPSATTAARFDAVVARHGNVTIAPHGVDHARFRPNSSDPDGDRADVAELAGYGINAQFVAFVGTIEPRKELPTLIAAFADIAAHFPDLQLVLAGGDGWGAAEVRAAVARSGVATHILRPGYLPDATVAALYRQAAVVAYPSRAEGFGLPALEALACAAPLVTTRGTAMDEFVGDAAVRVTPGDVGELAAGLREALDPPRAAELRRAGPSQAAPYTWEACVDRHLSAYRAAFDVRVPA